MSTWKPKAKPPTAQRKIEAIERHGYRIEDPYAWLKDPNWREVVRNARALDPAIRAYLAAENAYCDTVLGPLAPLEEAIFNEFRGRLEEHDSTVPLPDGPYAYYRRFDRNGEHPVFCRIGAGNPRAKEEILLHGDREAEGTSFFQISTGRHSPDHTLFAYSVDLTGSEMYTIRIKEIATGRVFTDEIGHAQGNFVWANDGVSLFYTVLDDHHRPTRVFRHRVGTDAAEDVLVYEERDPGFFVTIARTKSGRFIVIDTRDRETSETYLVDADNPAEPPVHVAQRTPNLLYSVEHHGGELFIRTNADGAEDFKIVRVAVSDPRRRNWQDLIPHRPGTLIVAFEMFSDFLVRLERVDALPRITVRELASGREHAVAFDEEVYNLGLVGGFEFDTHLLRFIYSSMTTPEQSYDYDMAARVKTLRKQQELPSGHRPEDYVTRRLFAPSHDGQLVPISVLYRRDTPIDGSAPLLLYGYGSYGFAFPAAFVTTRFSLVDRGFVYAIAHVRGGTERGYRWYRDGKRLKKKNTFLDFIAAAEHLVKEGYGSNGRIACHGRSAGGMLIGSVVNMRPDLFNAAVADVPFVDVLNTMCDATLPLTPPEWLEWGNPITDGQLFEYIRSYSPYDNVEAKAYPHIMATAGLTDPRVTYWEPAKWVAKLRSLKTDDNLLLLRTNMEAGHAGAAGRFNKLRETATVYAFLLLAFEMVDAEAFEPATSEARRSSVTKL